MTLADLRAAGFELSEPAHSRLAHFVHLLLEENQKLNLTAARDETQVWREHICDCLMLLAPLREQNVGSLLDIGSGGGLPGLPLACACENLDVTLLDATRKKTAATDRIIAQLNLHNARTLWGRAETLAHDPAYRERFDAVTARALATLPVLIEYAAGFVRAGGHGWFFKSAAGLGAESLPAESAARACQLLPAGVTYYRLPGDQDERPLVYYRKHGVLNPDLPRRPGRATRRAL